MSRIAIYPGSFDPLTNGHLDVIQRAATQFDEVIVAIGLNSNKKPMLPADIREHCIREATKETRNVRVESFDGLVVNFAREQGATALVRGLRATSDFDYEFQIAMANRRLAPELETIFLMTKWEHSYLSSSIVREVALLGGDYSSFVPGVVYSILGEYLARTS
ncbi:MAG: pantetheine-phosphate adenylyltransferase [Chthonomonas sp.]|nr:pantetheine-phosphate adenylyltransferase [Chthonomonas sp.]